MHQQMTIALLAYEGNRMAGGKLCQEPTAQNALPW